MVNHIVFVFVLENSRASSRLARDRILFADLQCKHLCSTRQEEYGQEEQRTFIRVDLEY